MMRGEFQEFQPMASPLEAYLNKRNIPLIYSQILFLLKKKMFNVNKSISSN